jgi:hypothetical protein
MKVFIVLISCVLSSYLLIKHATYDCSLELYADYLGLVVDPTRSCTLENSLPSFNALDVKFNSTYITVNECHATAGICSCYKNLCDGPIVGGCAQQPIPRTTMEIKQIMGFNGYLTIQENVQSCNSTPYKKAVPLNTCMYKGSSYVRYTCVGGSPVENAYTQPQCAGTPTVTKLNGCTGTGVYYACQEGTPSVASALGFGILLIIILFV